MSLNISSYGSQILTSGDLVVRDAISGSQHTVDQSTGLGIHSAYVVLASGVAQEATRQVHMYDPDKALGRYSSSCLRTDNNEQTQSMPATLETDPEKTKFTSTGVSATLSQGLSFNSDESAIYFGGSKTFRLMYSSDPPERLVFQYLDPSSMEYVTKFSCAKS